MSVPTNIFRLIPPTLPPGYCPVGPNKFQQLANDVIGGTRLTVLIEIGGLYYNYGDTTPVPENRGFPWIHTGNGLLWLFRDGVWTSPRALLDTSFRWMWRPVNGTPESALWALDGGDGTNPSTNPPTETTGAMWEIDHELDGVFPLAPGLIPGTAVTKALGDAGGEYEHTLTDAEGAVGNHKHPIGLTNQDGGGSSDDAYFFMQNSPTAVPASNGFYITGSNGRTVVTQTQADLYTLSANNGAGQTSTPFRIMPPYKVIGGWAKPTARLYRTLPA